MTHKKKPAPASKKAAKPKPAPDEAARTDQPAAAKPEAEPEAATEPAAEQPTAAEPEAEAEPEPEAATEPEAAAEAEDAAALTAEVDDLKDRLLRALAETENVRRRAAKEREDVSKYAITAFARDLLPVVDNLRRAIDSIPDEARKDERLTSVVAGVEMNERELLSILERHGIRRIEPLGEKFDHNYHQAMFEVEDSDTPAGTVVEVVQAGYVLEDRLLRAAMVAVAKSPKTESRPRVDTEA
jgi:molecular chaperone GrpE